MATIVTRAGKGSPLTNAEVDANFENLNTEVGNKADQSALTTAVNDLNIAVAAREPTISVGSPGQFLSWDKTWQVVDTYDVATTSIDGLMSSTDKVKLNGIASGATANDTDTNLKNRANHTGTQAISTVTGLQDALDGKLDTTGGSLTGGIQISTSHATTPTDVTNHIRLHSTGYGFSTSSGNLNYVAPSTGNNHTFYTGGETRFKVTSSGVTVVGGINGSPAHREPAISLTGNTLDLSAGTDFYKTISANTTITLSNVGAAGGLAQAASLIVNHTGGTITFTGATLKWAGGSAPTISTGRRHQFFFWPDPTTNQVLVSMVSYY